MKSNQENNDTLYLKNQKFNIQIKLSAAYSILMGLLSVISFVLSGNNTGTMVLVLVSCIILSIIISIAYNKWGKFNWSKTDMQIMVLIPIICAIITIGFYYIYSFNNVDARYIAPSFRRPLEPLPYVYTYGTNTRVKNSIYKPDKNSLDPANFFLRLEFVMYCDVNVIDCNGGWVISNSWGYDVSNNNYLAFYARGAMGGEYFGIGIKDKNNSEVKIYNISDYLKGKELSIELQEVKIPLIEFRNRYIDLTNIDNVSFFVDSKHTEQRVIEFDITQLHFK